MINCPLLTFQQEEEHPIPHRMIPPKLDLLANTLEASDVPPPLPKSPPPLDSENLRQRAELVNGNSEPEAKYPSALRNGEPGIVAPPVQKKVSWNDTVEASTPPFNGSSNPNNSSFTLQDIDEVLGGSAEPEESATFSMMNTPNVIGAQEVYRDPRERIKLEKMKSQPIRPALQGPEKLSFKDKIKMFAMEASQQAEAARNKVTNSKAEREIVDGHEQLDEEFEEEEEASN